MLRENLNVFFKHFGEPVTAERDGATLTEFVGIYNNPDLGATFGNTLAIDARAHTILCKESDATALLRDDIITIRATRYRLAEKRADGTGMIILVVTAPPDNDDE